MHGFARRRLLLAATTLPLARPALAAFPEQPIRVIVPWNAGGLADIVVRGMAAGMTEALGQAVVVENRPGANGAIGTQAVARAAPDGYTLIQANAETHAINPLIYPRLPYDPVADFTPVTVLVRAPFMLGVRQGLGVQDMAGLLALARASPGKLSFASWGIGSIGHLALEALLRDQGLQMLHVPYTGGSQAIVALLAEQVDVSLVNIQTAASLTRDGKAKLLAAGTAARIPLFPDVPTLAESGVRLEIANWFGLLGPARMASPLAERIAAAAAATARTPQVQALMRTWAAIPVFSTPEETRRFIAADTQHWAGVVRALDLRLE
jgi:tripartite-type tricarboxylate transporter receptor subunit TctC